MCATQSTNSDHQRCSQASSWHSQFCRSCGEPREATAHLVQGLSPHHGHKLSVSDVHRACINTGLGLLATWQGRLPSPLRPWGAQGKSRLWFDHAQDVQTIWWLVLTVSRKEKAG